MAKAVNKMVITTLAPFLQVWSLKYHKEYVDILLRIKCKSSDNMIENIDTIRKDAITEIKEKIKKNPGHSGYIHPCNKERQEDMRILGFESGHKFVRWAQQNGILRNPTEVDREYTTKIVKNAGFDNINEYVMHNWRHRRYMRDISSNQELYSPISYQKGSVEWFKEKIRYELTDELDTLKELCDNRIDKIN